MKKMYFAKNYAGCANTYSLCWADTVQDARRLDAADWERITRREALSLAANADERGTSTISPAFYPHSGQDIAEDPRYELHGRIWELTEPRNWPTLNSAALYTPKSEHADAFWGSADPTPVSLAELAQLAEGWQMSFGDLLEQVDAIEPVSTCEPEYWYAVMSGPEDDDWGSGSYDRAEAERRVRNLIADGCPDAYIAIIDESDENDPCCVGTIRDI